MADDEILAGTYVALLRGINVGGKNKLLMKDLVTLFERVGCDDVRAYIQSGNVVFEASATVAASLEAEVQREIAERFDLTVPVVLRTVAELRTAVAGHPFVAEAEDPKHLAVGFLGRLPSPEAVASLDPTRSSVDRFAVVGKHVYLYFPGGTARSKLTTGYFDRRLETIMTVRNWRTVNELLAMAGG